MADFPESPKGDRSTERGARGTQRRWIALAVGALVGIGVVGLAVWWFVLRDDAPPPATLEAAVEGLETTTTSEPTETTGPSEPSDTTATSEPSSETPAATDLDGTWSVDTTIGSFDDFTSSWVGYRIDEELDPIGANTAVGRTPDVSGSLTLAGTTVEAVSVEADMQTLRSDIGLRDDQLRNRGLETDTFPTASFTLTEPIALAAIPAESTTITTEAVGELTLHGVTRPVTLALDAELVGDVIAVVGSTEIALADYDMDPPTTARVLSVADTGELELQLFFTRD